MIWIIRSLTSIIDSFIQHTEIPHRGIEDKRSHQKKDIDIKAKQSFPKQTLITDILQTDILNLGI